MPSVGLTGSAWISTRGADALLRKNGSGFLTDAVRLSTLNQYQVLPGSPAIDAGLDLRERFKSDPGERDFYGNKIPQGVGYDVGAHAFTRAQDEIRPGKPTFGGKYD